MKMCPLEIVPGGDADLDPAGSYARRSGQVLAIELTLTILALFSIIHHVYKAFTNGGRPSRGNNFFLVVAGILALAHTCLTVASLNISAGSLLKVALFKAIIDALIIFAAQLSLLSLYLRWASKLRRSTYDMWFRICAIIFFCLMSATIWIAYASLCASSWGSWSTSEKPEVCQSLYGGQEVRIVVGTILYVGIALAPVPMIRRSRLVLRQKAEVIGILTLGLIPLGLFLIRMVTLLKCDSSVFWVIYSDIFSVAEFSTAIMIVSMAHSQPTWVRLQPPEEMELDIWPDEENNNAEAPPVLQTAGGDRGTVSGEHFTASIAMDNLAPRHSAD